MKKITYALLGSLLMLGAVSFNGCKTKDVVANDPPPVTPPDTTPVTPPDTTKPVTPGTSDIATWLTTKTRSATFEKQNVSLNFTATTPSGNIINVDPSIKYQSIDGFGFALTDGSAMVINAMPEPQKSDLIKELFATDSTHIGISYLRVTIGASDLSPTDYTYDDIPSDNDFNLDHFSIDPAKANLIPVLKKILAINPDIKILGSPWTAPVWMKTGTIGNGGFTGGSLRTDCYDVYGNYFVKYIQAMKAEGITIDAITPQNEPLNPNNNPAMVVQPQEEANFIKSSLGPKFAAAGITTKIIAYDHNADRTDYPTTVFKDADANPYVDGSAFHLYGGTIGALTAVHNAFPTKNLYFTEWWIGGPGSTTTGNNAFGSNLSTHIENLIIGAPRNWCRNVIEWNLASDPSYSPHTSGGCGTCEGALTISGSTVVRNVSYYIIAHAAKFVRPGAVRIASDMVSSLPNVAFKNTDGTIVLIVLNKNSSKSTFNITVNNKSALASLDAGAVATYVWK